MEADKVQRIVKCTTYSTVLREPNAYLCSLLSRFVALLLREKTSTSEPNGPSASTPSVGEKSPLVQNHAEAHPETLLPCISELFVRSRPSLSFLSDLFFGAHLSPPSRFQQLIVPDPTDSIPVLDSAHGTPRHPLLLLRVEARAGWTRIRHPHYTFPTPPWLHIHSIIRHLSCRPYRIGRCCWHHRTRSLVGREYVGPSCCRNVWRLLYRNSLGRGVAV